MTDEQNKLLKAMSDLLMQKTLGSPTATVINAFITAKTEYEAQQKRIGEL